MPVVLVAADLVGGLAAELHDMKGVEAHLGVRDRGADRFLIASGHVDRDRLDRRFLLLGQLREEALQGVSVAARGGPHNPGLLMVGDAGQELVIGAVADLVHTDLNQPVQPALVELVGDDPLEDLPNRLPRNPHQPPDRGLVHLLGQERGHVLKVPRVRRARSRPRHHLVHVAARRAVQASEPALDRAPDGAEIQMPPALGSMLLDLQPARPTARAHRLPGLQRDGHDHALGAERHVPHPCTRQRQHLVECGDDPHVALLRRPLNFEHPAACRPGAAAGRPACAQLASLDAATPQHPRSGAVRRASSGSLRHPDAAADPHDCRRFGRLTRASAPLSGNDHRPGGRQPSHQRPTTRQPAFTPKRRGVPHKGMRCHRTRPVSDKNRIAQLTLHSPSTACLCRRGRSPRLGASAGREADCNRL